MTEARAKELHERSGTYQTLINQINGLKMKAGIDAGAKVDIVDYELEDLQFDKEIADPKTLDSSGCVRGAFTGQPRVDTECECGDKCPSFPKSRKFDFKGKYAPLRSQYDQVTGAGDQLLQNNLTGAAATAGTGPNLAANRRKKDKLMETLKKLMEKNGQKFDIPEKINSALKGIRSKVRAAMKKNGVSGKDLLAGLGGASAPASKEAIEEANKKEDDTSKTGGEGAVAVNKAGGGDLDALSGLLEDEQRGEDMNSADEFSKFKTKAADINKNESGDIFKIISNRYLRSAYKVLADRIEEAPSE